MGPFANCKDSVLKLFFVLAAVAGAPLLAQAQGVPFGIPGYSATASPWGFSIKRVNNLDTAPITFEGQHLFVVAAPAAPAEAAIPAIVQRVQHDYRQFGAHRTRRGKSGKQAGIALRS